MVQIRAREESNNFICGAISGAVSRTLTAPVDRLRVILQTESSKTLSIRQGIQLIYRQGGLLAFYTGNGINVTKIVCESGIKFYGFEKFKSMIAQARGTQELGPFSRFLAGGGAGLLMTTINYPFDLVKTRLQVSKVKPSIPGMVKDIWRCEGSRAFYRGLAPSLVGIYFCAGIDLAMYDTLKNKAFATNLVNPDSKSAPLVHSGCGLISAAVGTSSVYPLNVIRTRMQAQSLVNRDSEEFYTGTLDGFKKTFAKEGVRGFYKGIIPNLCKVVPSSCITYVVYEQMKRILNVKTH